MLHRQTLPLAPRALRERSRMRSHHSPRMIAWRAPWVPTQRAALPDAPTAPWAHILEPARPHRAFTALRAHTRAAVVRRDARAVLRALFPSPSGRASFRCASAVPRAFTPSPRGRRAAPSAPRVCTWRQRVQQHRAVVRAVPLGPIRGPWGPRAAFRARRQHFPAPPVRSRAPCVPRGPTPRHRARAHAQRVQPGCTSRHRGR